MSRAIYSASEIKSRMTCVEYATSQGATIKNGRTKAWWRSGDNPEAVHIEDLVWHDFVTKQGGSVIDLCAVCECGDIGATMKAMTILGERLNLTPIKSLKSARKSRSEILIEKGYKATATYDYRDENGNVMYSIVRFEKDEYKEGEHKEFIHRTEDHEGLDSDTKKILYNLPAVIKAQEVFIVEGEKDADTLNALGLVATTNSGGASNWQQYFNPYFKDKDVIVLPDNDEPGRKHGEIVRDMLVPLAKSVKVISLSQLPKGDVTDWMNKEGGSLQKLRDAIDNCERSNASLSPEIAAAKLANQQSFTNFREVKKSNSRKSEEPISINEILEDAKTRFLGYPRNLGGELFDWSRKTNDVLFISNHNALFAWIQRISKKPVMWAIGTGMVSRNELYEAMLQDAPKYSGISSAPHFPPRKDVFYTHGSFPPADPSHSTFWRLIGFFNPADDANRTLMAAMFCAPMFYKHSASRPMWIIDTNDSQGSGKTTIVKMIAHLYGHTPISIDLAQLERDQDQIIKRLISTEGRRARVALIDNVTRTLGSPNLAMLVTQSVISGRPAYGRGEEIRPNDITWIATVNGAQVNTDIASRSYTVRINKPAVDNPHWEDEVALFIDNNRLQIYSDILDQIRNNQHAGLVRKGSRFGAFDQIILSSVCKGDDEFYAACESIAGENERANEDSDRAEEFLDLFESAIVKHTDDRENKIDPSKLVITDGSLGIFIKNTDIDYILSHSDGILRKWTVSQIVQLVRQGRVRFFSKNVDRIPRNNRGLQRNRGLLYVPEGSMDSNGRVVVQVIERKMGIFIVTDTIPMTVIDRKRKDKDDVPALDDQEEIPF